MIPSLDAATGIDAGFAACAGQTAGCISSQCCASRRLLIMRFGLYSCLRPILFALPAECAHALVLSSLQVAHRLGVTRRPRDDDRDAATCMGLRFPNRVGLAAGLDKNARHIDALGSLGFGFIEVGTVTPRPQPGQSRPRLFRIPAQRALINRMGFPNDGADAVAPRLARRKYAGVLGVNIGKNAATPLNRSIDDYVACYRRLAPHADYVAVNVSSPNTQGLRQLQHVDYLRPILAALMEEEGRLRARKSRRTPLLAKIAPDLAREELIALARLFLELQLDGVIATNTTVSRPAELAESEQGGLSGAPLLALSQQTIRLLRSQTEGRLVIIAAGGIMCGDDARQSLHAGADLLQVYSGLIYRGPALVSEIRSALIS